MSERRNCGADKTAAETDRQTGEAAGTRKSVARHFTDTTDDAGIKGGSGEIQDRRLHGRIHGQGRQRGVPLQRS